MSSIKATRFVCEPPFTPFAPVWDYTIAQTTSDIDLESLAEYILVKEKEIISEYKEDLDDGMTSLGDDSLTSRFKYFNVLKWDHPECKKLLDEIGCSDEKNNLISTPASDMVCVRIDY